MSIGHPGYGKNLRVIEDDGDDAWQVVHDGLLSIIEAEYSPERNCDSKTRVIVDK
ncbi:predicted protein [Coccidioides posadasii str. Silveira]|uniref:Predicted protein n=1 Tax=Coccidioides posadasii (strain RMSCC 757 / Silveira) TaxID=443226 RepID=E9DFQ6_COCPS|nr:predicted protein [Coccidioides posadasii str. Silveira]